ncbi:GntR family transcriptional regulator [Tersicoccus solisilvae]|uniref:GntR family transcriptional regulator n=1 Tax=Tersicoccus solisilvae TaxID=1882339 RepID=A0ABQ1PA73_9MICC|nr:GntR family transcriptional regulator [Tersicoccus solisilvae]GGC93866.1 GntR family transcriptional regulator [Tersicoccus solisilvae]
MRQRVTAATSGRERAYAYLRDEILSDPARQGTFLNETELAASIGVSRTPVREALLLLVADGLIEMIPQRGARVPVVGRQHIHDLMQLRSMLECQSALITLRDRTAPVGAMDAVLAAQEDLADGGDERAFIDLDRDFHQALIDAVGNGLLSASYAKLRSRQIVIGVEALFRSPERQRQVVAEHRAILAALQAGDDAAATAAIVEHLRVTERVLLGG